MLRLRQKKLPKLEAKEAADAESVKIATVEDAGLG